MAEVRYKIETLVVDLMDLKDQIDRQMDILMIEATKMKCSPFEMRLANGSWPLAGLINSKAQVLNSLVLLIPDDK